MNASYLCFTLRCCSCTESSKYLSHISYVTVNLNWLSLNNYTGRTKGTTWSKDDGDVLNLQRHKVTLWAHCPPHHFNIDGTQRAWHMSICQKWSFIHHSGVPSPKKHFASIETGSVFDTRNCQLFINTEDCSLDRLSTKDLQSIL